MVILKKIILILFAFFYITANINANNQEKIFWEPVIKAIIKIESNGNHNAVSKCGRYVGPMQISKVLVDDVNIYLRMKKTNKRFTYQDRFNLEKSKEMFYLIQERYNKSNNIEKAVRIWNGGCGYSIKSTNGYYQKFLKHYKKSGN